MSISREQIATTARLARLRVDESETAELTERISAILDMVDQMQSIDTSNVEPMANSLDAVQQLRPDAIAQPDDSKARRETLLANAPASEDGLFLVPKVID